MKQYTFDEEPISTRLRLPKSLLEKIDKLAESTKKSRNAIIIQLILEALSD